MSILAKPVRRILRGVVILSAVEGLIWCLGCFGTRSHEELQARSAAGESESDRHHPPAHPHPA